MWFSANQLTSSMENSKETDLKTKTSLKQKQNSPQVTAPVDKMKKVDRNIEIEKKR